ncbi:MAG: BolA family protein [Pseudomonadota bacterium]
MTAARVAKIQTVLEDAFKPQSILVKDQSHLHAGHAGAQDGLGHFHVTIVSEAFDGMNRVKTHQAIYGALGDMMQTDIHALAINASAPK